MANTNGKEEKEKVKQTLLKMLEASNKNDRKVVESLYAPDAEIFFDITKQPEVDLSQMIAEGTAPENKDYKIVPNNDQRIHVSGQVAWVTATGSATPTSKERGEAEIEWRYTGILEKRGSDWLIVHEHTSMPS